MRNKKNILIDGTSQISYKFRIQLQNLGARTDVYNMQNIPGTIMEFLGDMGNWSLEFVQASL
jgi:hypothetical protein